MFYLHPVLPCGRNSGQKAQKGSGKKSWPEEFVAEFYQKWQKRGQRKYSKVVPSFTVTLH
jgi:hypothetical protein